jgi:hypothetical protein
MTLAKIVSFVEDGPWCGTKPPGFHPPRPGHLESLLRNNLADEAALNPQPLPPQGETAAFLWQAVRLHQYANLLTSAKVLGSMTMGSAAAYLGRSCCAGYAIHHRRRRLGSTSSAKP